MEERLKLIKALKPMLPGTLEAHYNICGKAVCRCKDKINPRKHGPYYRLSYNLMGENSSVFVKAEDAEAVKEMAKNYKKSRENIMGLSLEMIHSYRHDGLDGMLAKYTKAFKRINKGKFTIPLPEPPVLRRARLCCKKWKNKALKRQGDLEKDRIKIRNMEESRKIWKQKAFSAQKQVKLLQKELMGLKRTFNKIEGINNIKKNSTDRKR